MRLGYVLSGGGARGIAHLGILKVLEEHGIHPEIISGTSAGAIIGAFYAHGYKADEILSIIDQTRLMKILRPAFSLEGIISLEKSYSFFKQYLPEDSFESLGIPLHIAAVNLKTGLTRFFSSGQLIHAVFASAAIPVIFNPINIEGDDFVDGGVLNNLPVEPLRDKCEILIGFHCNPIDSQFTQRRIRNVVERAFLLATSANVENRKKVCDYFLEPEGLYKFGAFDFAKAKEIFKMGYDYAKKKVPDIAKLIFI